MIIEDWNNDLGIAQCIIEDTSTNGVTLRGYGKATCHDDDEQWKSELTGKYIAMTRAQIDILRKKRDYEIIPSIMALEHVLSTMEQSKKYNPKSYEAIRIKKELKHYQEDLHMVQTIIVDEQENLRLYLAGKDQLHHQDENK